MLVLAIAVGLVTGTLAWLLIETIRLVQQVAYGAEPGLLRVLVVPTVGALAGGLLVTYVVPEAAGSGVVQTMRTIAVRGGRFRRRVPLTGALTSGLSLGAGITGGREGPIVLVGGGTGSILGRWFGLDEDRIRGLVAAGAAAGIGASFNAPIGGMLFAVELIIGGFRAASLQAVVVASVVGSVTAHELVGDDLIYGPAVAYALDDPRQLLLYAVLGLAAVPVGLGFLYGTDLATRLSRRIEVWPPLRVAAGGLAVGVLAVGVPEILGTGNNLPALAGVVREPIQEMLDARLGTGLVVAGFLLLLAAAKLVATCVAIGTGNAVGIFAPVIFTGAAVGGAVGHAAERLLPAAGVAPGAFALVGMAAAFGAAARTPLTAIVIVFELTGDYGLVLPLMLATGLATFLADQVSSDSVYTLPLRREGIVYTDPHDIDILQTVTVGEIMTSPPDTVPADVTVEQLREAFRRSGHHGFPVVEDGDRLVGVVTLADVEEAAPEASVRHVCTHDPVVVTPDQPVFRAVERMGSLDVGRIPVVDADRPDRLVGLVRRSDLVEAYRRAVAKSAAAQQRRESSELRDLVGVHFLELSVDPEAPAAGRKIRAVDWPERTVITSIRRDGRVVLPEGDTVVRAGDEVVVLTDEAATEQLLALLGGAPPEESGQRR